MKTVLRKMGNSQGIIIPKALITQFGFSGEIDMQVTEQGIVLSKPKNDSVRQGWALASQDIAQSDENQAAWPEFANENDKDWEW